MASLVHDIEENTKKAVITLNVEKFLVMAVFFAALYILIILFRFYLPDAAARLGIIMLAVDLLPFILLFAVTVIESYLIVRKMRMQGFELASCCWYSDTRIEMKKNKNNK
jgi:hypothetical protein